MNVDGDKPDHLNILANSQRRNSKNQEIVKKMTSTQIPKNIIPIDISDEEEKKGEDLPSPGVKNNTTTKNIPLLTVNSNQVTPQVLPIYRGLHICGKNFSDKFKQIMLQDSMKIASTLNSDEKVTDTDSLASQTNNLFKNKYVYP